MDVPIVVNGDTCIMHFNYKYRICGTDTTRIQIVLLGWSDPDTNCAFRNYYDSLWAANIAAYWQLSYNIQDQATLAIGKKRFLDFRIYNGNPSDFNCNDLPNCTTSGTKIVQVLTFYDKCQEFIDAQGGAPIVGGYNPCPGITYVVPCLSQQCCLLLREMCYDNGTVHICETTLQGSGSVVCSGNATFTPPNGCTIIRRSGCIPRCQ
jgi:hypothetical protein